MPLMIIIFALFFFSLSHFPLTLSLNPEVLYLHQAKLTLSDPTGFLSTWHPAAATPCNFTGVTCAEGSIGSVVAVNLASANVAGPFPLSLCHLTSLSSLCLYNNNINSFLPSDISKCRNLRTLNLAQNLLIGTLPESLADIPNLTHLDLSSNSFSGEIPASFGRFSNLREISLVGNLLDGKFPSFLWNVSTLRQLNLSYNPFQPSRFLPEIGNFTSLEILWAAQCNLVGEIPNSLGRLGRLTDLDLSTNRLHGSIPSSLTGLTRIVQIELYNNSFTGKLPSSGWSNLTELRFLDASMNELNGTIPDELTRLPLASLNLYENSFEGDIPKSIANSPYLFELKLFSNRFTGELPSQLGENSPLNILDVSNNFLTGEIPPNLCSKEKLEELLMIHNSFSGQIPVSFGQCRTLTRVRLGSNKITGKLPDNFWGLPRMSLLGITKNYLSGEISKSILSASNLSQLVISNNNFSGKIPEEVGFLKKLVTFVGGDNIFSGSLPNSIVNLGQLGRLDLHNNELSGEIPTGIKSLNKLNELNLGNNEFSGLIPGEMGSLSTLNYLDLSGNQLSGLIPLELQNLKLNQLNLSNNRLSGEIPPLFAKEIYRSSFLGNPGLCGDIYGLCDGKNGVKTRGYLWLLRYIFILAAIVFIVGMIWFYWKYQNFKKDKRGIDRSKWTLMSFHKLGFDEYEILDCLDEDNVIGSGASGKVYRAILSNGEAVAVKKLWSSSKKLVDVENGGVVKDHDDDDVFEAEVETLGKIRHKNIVRLWCCCKAKDCKLLVYEFMPNGSLGDLLHSQKGGLLDWPTRFRIALDAAEGLSYLHHDCVPPIVHRDVKSNNILLDGSFGAKVADFGVAKVVDATGRGAKTMSVIAGSYGYIAPEYAYILRVNEKSDIYSFGVVILELVTGKQPVDPQYGEKDLVKWVCTTMDHKGMDHVVDPKLESWFKDDIYKVLTIGLICTSPLPINRPSMRKVVKLLREVRGENQSKLGNIDGHLTPYYYEDASDHGIVA